MTTKHSNKSPFLAVAAALAILVIAAPALAAGSQDHAEGNSALSWNGALDAVEEWLKSAFALFAGSDAAVSRGGDGEECPSDNCAEGFPGVDPNGEPSPEVDPEGDGSAGSNPGAEYGPDVDPNG